MNRPARAESAQETTCFRPACFRTCYPHTHLSNVVRFRTAVLCSVRCVLYSGVGVVPRPSEVDESYGGEQTRTLRHVKREPYYDTTVLVSYFLRCLQCRAAPARCWRSTQEPIGRHQDHELLSIIMVSHKNPSRSSAPSLSIVFLPYIPKGLGLPPHLSLGIKNVGNQEKSG